MRFAPYWAKVICDDTVASRQWVAGWSFESQEDAQRKARERWALRQKALERLHAAIAKYDDEMPPPGEARERWFHQMDEELKRLEPAVTEYDYDELPPLREEVLERVRIGDDEVAVITRNRYGALVLNTADVMFADIDIPTEPTAPLERGLRGMIERLFSARHKQREQARFALALEQLRDRLANVSAHAVRIYRTNAGFRLLFTDRRHDPTAAETFQMLNALCGDPMYLRLTRRQECFRARLTPKPWRCHHSRPRIRFPYVTLKEEETHRLWVRAYNRRSKPYKVCELVDRIGPEPNDSTIREITSVHDSYCCDKRKTKLA